MTLLQALTETGLLEDFKDICTPDVTAKEALQWLKRRQQLIKLVKGWPTETYLMSFRRKLGCPGTSQGGPRKNTRNQRIVEVNRKVKVRPSKAHIPVDCGRQSRRYAPTDESFYE